MRKENARPSRHYFDTMMEDRADIPLNAIHMYSGLKADIYLMRMATHFGRAHFKEGQLLIMVRLLGRYMFIPGGLDSLQAHVFGIEWATQTCPGYCSDSSSEKNQLEFGYIEEWLTNWDWVLFGGNARHHCIKILISI
ncbi:MAG: hypothetical protein IPJ46_09440 [Anaerolineales bacterium]|nr:hypothetical protein [Anaerolineales bacterium]